MKSFVLVFVRPLLMTLTLYCTASNDTILLSYIDTRVGHQCQKPRLISINLALVKRVKT